MLTLRPEGPCVVSDAGTFHNVPRSSNVAFVGFARNRVPEGAEGIAGSIACSQDHLPPRTDQAVSTPGYWILDEMEETADQPQVALMSILRLSAKEVVMEWWHNPFQRGSTFRGSCLCSIPPGRYRLIQALFP